MRILFIGDIVASAGRRLLSLVPALKEKEGIDLIIANGENAAGGFGLTRQVSDEIFEQGIDVLTMGNHVWDRKEIYQIIDDPRIVRPANYPEGVPGHGWTIVQDRKGLSAAVVNLSGRVFMADLDCPFHKAGSVLDEIAAQTKVIIVDFHGEATSEKVAMGWYLDGRVTAVIGTHTHIPTSDERVLPEGTAYITDVGMTGGIDSVIGVKKEAILKRFLTQMPVKMESSSDNPVLQGVLIDADEQTGRAISIKRIALKPGA